MTVESKAHVSQLEQLMNRARGGATARPQPEPSSSPHAVDDADPYEPADYEWGPNKAFTTAKGGRRQPGFAIITQEDDACYWIFYHSIRKLRSFRMNGQDYIQFAHDGLAVTIQGQRLYVILTMIGEGRLKCMFSPAPDATAPSRTDPFITAVLVTDTEVGKVNTKPELVKSA